MLLGGGKAARGYFIAVKIGTTIDSPFPTSTALLTLQHFFCVILVSLLYLSFSWDLKCSLSTQSSIPLHSAFDWTSTSQSKLCFQNTFSQIFTSICIDSDSLPPSFIIQYASVHLCSRACLNHSLVFSTTLLAPSQCIKILSLSLPTLSLSFPLFSPIVAHLIS